MSCGTSNSLCIFLGLEPDEAVDFDLFNGTVFSSGSNSIIVSLASVPLRLERSLREGTGGSGGGDGDDDILSVRFLVILCIMGNLVG